MTEWSTNLRAAIAATRFGLGARPGEIQAAANDPAGWLQSQVRPSGADLFTGDSTAQATARLEEAQQSRGQARERQRDKVRSSALANGGEPAMARALGKDAMATASMTAQPGQADAGVIDAADRERRQARREATLALQAGEDAVILSRAQLACTTQAPFRERWALFWSNHFTVSDKKKKSRGLPAPFELEAIRPHVFGDFTTLLIASSTHPAMLRYLDEIQSVGPDSETGVRAVERKKGKGGLNENLAREIMELHTVGADGGYSQADVTEFALALTGLSVERGRGDDGEGAGAMVFRAERHQPGQRMVMGRRFDEGGLDQVRAILTDLSRRPQTRQRLCAKLAAHFVSDTPDPQLVARLSEAWRASDGDLAEVARTLVRAPEAWVPAASKFKTPYELIISTYRVVGAAPAAARPDVIVPLMRFGQPVFAPPQPNGWSDDAGQWASPDAVIKRLEWAVRFGEAARLGDITDLARSSLGARLQQATLASLTRGQPRPEAFALLILSPEFQRR